MKVRTPWSGTDVPSEIEDPTVTKLLDALGFARAPQQRVKALAKGA